MVMAEFNRDLEQILSCEALKDVLSKWFILFGTNADDFVEHDIKRFDEKRDDDTHLFDNARKAGKKARYSKITLAGGREVQI